MTRDRDDPCFGPSSREERECFGIRYGGVIVGLIFGFFIIIIGITLVLGQDIGRYIGPAFVIILGLLIIAGALSALSRRRGQST